MAPDLGLVLIVSFRVGDEVKTLFYDRRQLPAEVQRLYDLTGADLERAK